MSALGCLTTSTPEDPGGPDYLDFDPAPDGPVLVADAGGWDPTRDASAAWPNDAGGGSVGPGASDASLARDAAMPDAGGAGARDAGGTGGTGGALASCTINASTDASGKVQYNGKYGCAVWVGDGAKKVVKTFFVATRIASRTGLPSYRTASSGVTVDVVTGATLTQPMQHNYTWTNNGGALPSGSYTLNVETHSSSGVNFVSIPFATSAGSVSATGNPNGDVKSASISCK